MFSCEFCETSKNNLFTEHLRTTASGISVINISLPFFSVITHFTCHFILLLGDSDACVNVETMKDFCSSYCLKRLIKQATCFKNSENPSCIDLVLTNKPRRFHSTCVIETGLSDFNKMTVSVLKMYFCRLPPEAISYRDFEIVQNERLKTFENERFMDSLYLVLTSQNIDYIKPPDLLFNICQNKLNHHAPRKK